jgi:hypothetical protein
MPLRGILNSATPEMVMVVGSPVLDLLASGASLPLAHSDPNQLLASVGLQPVGLQQGFLYTLPEDLDQSAAEGAEKSTQHDQRYVGAR